MQEFLDERAGFNRKYYDLFGGALHPRLELERLESAKGFDSFAVAITRVDMEGSYMRHRYRLRPRGETWVIEKISYQCGLCTGTGKNPNDGQTCSKCKGEGWV